MNLASEAPVEDLIDRVLRDTGYLEELETSARRRRRAALTTCMN